jgi:hypothetical protein
MFLLLLCGADIFPKIFSYRLHVILVFENAASYLEQKSVIVRKDYVLGNVTILSEDYSSIFVAFFTTKSQFN